MFENGFPREWSTIRKLALLFRSVVNAVVAVLKTVTGNPIHILDALAKPAQSLSIALEPIQDLHGYDSPWPAGGGKNLLDPQGYTNGLVSLTIGDSINTITSSVRYTHSVPYDATDGLYISAQSLDNNYVNWVTINLYDSDDLLVNKITHSMVGDTWYSDVIPANTYAKALVQLGAPGGGITVDPSAAKVILAKGTTPVDWSPYSNECPISGHTDADVIVSPTLNQSDGTTYPIPLGTTVYGGTLDVLTGVLTVTHGIYTFSGNEAWTLQGGSYGGVKYYSTDYIVRGIAKLPEDNTKSVPIMTSIGSFNYSYIPLQYYPYAMCIAADGRFGIEGSLYNPDGDTLKDVQVVYELATPFTIQLTPTQVELLQGENNLFSDGEMTLVYLADGNASDVEALNILLGGRYVNNHEADEPTDREALNILLGGQR